MQDSSNFEMSSFHAPVKYVDAFREEGNISRRSVEFLWFIPYRTLRINELAAHVNFMNNVLVENNKVGVFTRIQTSDPV